MIIVTVELKSAISHTRDRVLARMSISNVGGDGTHGDYDVKTYRGRDAKTLDKRIVNRQGKVSNYPRLAIHVWHLVHEALKAVEYHRRPRGHG